MRKLAICKLHALVPESVLCAQHLLDSAVTVQMGGAECHRIIILKCTRLSFSLAMLASKESLQDLEPVVEVVHWFFFLAVIATLIGFLVIYALKARTAQSSHFHPMPP